MRLPRRPFDWLVAALAVTAGVATLVGEDVNGKPLNAVSVGCLTLLAWAFVVDALRTGSVQAPYAQVATERATDPTAFRVLVGIYVLVAMTATAVAVAVLVGDV